MKKLGHMIGWLIDGLTRLTGWTASLALISAAFIVTEGVIVRKIFGLSTIWQIEASVFLLIFTVFAGAPFVQKNEHHLNVDLVIVYLSPRKRELVLVIVSIITCFICGMLAWYSWPMWWESLTLNEHSESLWGPPLYIPHFFLPLGMTLLFLQYILYIMNKIKSLRRGDYDEDAIRTELKDIKISEADSELKP